MSAYDGDGARCHQYERRLELNEEDLPTCPFPRQQLKADAEGLWRVVVTNIESEFRFVPVPRDDISRLAEIEDFILRYEWLGSLPHRPTHYFTARTTATHGVPAGATASNPSLALATSSAWAGVAKARVASPTRPNLTEHRLSCIRISP